MKHTRPEDIFRAEKERAVGARNSQHARLLAEAKAAFDKLMAEGQAARKSGRPRKHPLPPLKTSSSRMPPPPVLPSVPAKPPVAAAPPVPVPASKPVAKAATPGKPALAKTASAKPKAKTAARAGATKRPHAKAKAKSKRSGR
jgi:hypothetical protein